MGRHFYVCILASGKHGTIYIGVTTDLIRRVYEHKEKLVPGFTKDHGIDKLVYYEIFDDPESPILRREAPQTLEAGLESRTDRTR